MRLPVRPSISRRTVWRADIQALYQTGVWAGVMLGNQSAIGRALHLQCGEVQSLVAWVYTDVIVPTRPPCTLCLLGLRPVSQYTLSSINWAHALGDPGRGEPGKHDAEEHDQNPLLAGS